jgi:hypothetical protein
MGVEIIDGWRKLYTEELHQVKEDEMGMACSTHWEMRNTCRVLVRFHTEKDH